MVEPEMVSVGERRRGPRPPGFVPSPVVAATCHGCGARGADRSAVADLEVLWLVPVPADGVVAARFCRGCRPTGAVGELACAGCGDGPLLSRDLLVEGDLATSATIDAWLTATGWRPVGPWCPACARVLHPSRARRTATVSWGNGT